MATNFPTSLDSFTNPSSSSTLDSPSHAAQHANINDAMVAVQTKLGTGAGTIGEWTNYTPVLEQVVTFGLTVNSSRYARLNEIVFYQGHITVSSGTGTAGNVLQLSLPLSYGASGNGAVGNAWIFDAGSATAYHAAIYYAGSDKVAFIGDWSGSNSFGVTPSIAIGFNDQLRFSIVYETDA